MIEEADLPQNLQALVTIHSSEIQALFGKFLSVSSNNRPEQINMKKCLIAATLVFTLPAVAAFAHGDDYDDYRYQHERDHREHYRYHDRIEEEHARAHAEGDWMPGEHTAYHRYLRWKHGEFHEDHPNTWHDHWRWW